MGTNETFYAALGVDADADADRIEAAYRERVKHTHPDVSDDDDAAAAFKRLTEARDVLVDDTARRRYDRVGHATYVREHLDTTVWTSADESERRSDRSPAGRDGPTGAASGRDAGTGTGAGDRGGTAGNYDRYKASGAASGDDESGREDRHGTGRGTHVGDDPFGGTDSAWPGSGTGGAGSTDGSGHATAGPGRRGAPDDGWQRTHTATGTYSPSGRDVSGAAAGGSRSVSSVRSGLAAVGPWLLFHVVFIVSALVTAGLLLTLSPTVPTALLGIALFGGALLASSLHVMSRLYS